MKTIFLMCSDENLAAELGHTLKGCEQIVRWRLGDSLPPASDPSDQLIVVDLRSAIESGLFSEFLHIREIIGPHRRLLLLATCAAGAKIEIVSRGADGVTGLILRNAEPMAHAIRAELNDQSSDAAAMISFCVLSSCLPPAAYDILCKAFGSGVQKSSVKVVAAVDGNDRGTPNRRLHVTTDLTSKLILKLARASTAAVLLRSTSLSYEAVAKLVGSGRRKQLDNLLTQIFALNSRELRAAPGDEDAGGWLTTRLEIFLHNFEAGANA